MAILIPPGYVHEIHSRTAIPLTDEDHDTHPHNPRLPKFNFPVYDGETTKLWITQAEDYFDMYGVSSYLWVKVVGMHFNGAAKCWIQSVECPSQLPWSDFCKLLLDHFAHDQRESLLRQMFHIQQNSSVIDYVEKFSTIVDQLKVYTNHLDMLPLPPTLSMAFILKFTLLSLCNALLTSILRILWLCYRRRWQIP